MEQLSISQSCQNIIDKRKNERLPAIEKKIGALKNLKDALVKLQEYQTRIKRNDSSLILIREKAPQIVDTITHLDLSSLLGDKAKIAKLEKELERLKKRFSREAIQIALVGPARRGKSTFLQSVSGLKDDVIPTSSYSDCTGAVCVIENTDSENFKIKIEYYDEVSFVKFFNNTLENIGSTHRVSSITDIRNLGGTLKVELQEKSDENIQKFYKEYYGNGLQYLDLIGSEPLTKDEESVVIEFVAKYKRFDNNEKIPDRYSIYRKEIGAGKTTVWFNKYLAVKSAHIWSKYSIPDAGKIIMLDTVGLGNENTEEKDRATMYQVLKEDTDAAIYNFSILESGMSNPPKDETTEIHGIFDELYNFSPEQWIAININCYDDSKFNGNDSKLNDYQDLCNQIYETIKTKKYGSKKDKTPLLVAKIHNNNTNEVVTKMMLPVLQAIEKNVSTLDDVFMSKAEEMADDIFEQYNDICSQILKSFGKIITQSGTFYNTFVSNFERLPLRRLLNEYVDMLYQQRDSVCPQIFDELQPQIDNLTDFVPSQKEIINKLHGMRGGHIHTVYFEVLDDVTARIMSKLNEVSTQTIGEIQEKIKTDLAKILYKEGRLSELSLSTGKMNDDSSAIKWLDSFSREKLTKYPSLEKAVRSVLDFRMNIEGFIFAECIKACESLKNSTVTFPDDNKPVDDKAYFIWNTIMLKVADMTTALSEGLGLINICRGFNQNDKLSEMAKPSLLMWCVADSFCKQFLDTNHGEDLKSFYSEYATIIWRNEFKLQEDISEATNEVNSLITILKSQNDRSLF